VLGREAQRLTVEKTGTDISVPALSWLVSPDKT